MNFLSILAGATAAAAILLTGCTVSTINADTGVSVVSPGKDSDAKIKKTVKISDFDEISASQNIKVIFTQGPNSGTASIATTPSAEKYLKLVVKDKKLDIYYANPGKKNVKIQGPTIVTVSSPELKEVELSSAASFVVKENLNVSGTLEVDLNSSGLFKAGSIVCGKLKVDASSAARAEIAELSGDLNADASSSASIKVGKVKGGKVSADVSSAANISMDGVDCSLLDAEASSAGKIGLKGIACSMIEAEASSAGRITLSGEAGSLNKEVSSGGSISTSSLSLTR